jgi:hypothetical protein
MDFGWNQIACNLPDADEGLLKGKHYLIHDRDRLFTAESLSTLAEVGVDSVKLPARNRCGPPFESYGALS